MSRILNFEILGFELNSKPINFRNSKDVIQYILNFIISNHQLKYKMHQNKEFYNL